MNTEYNLDLVIQAKNEASAQLQKVSNDVKKMKENIDDTKDSVSGLTSKQRQLNLKANTDDLKKELGDIRTEILNLERETPTGENIEKLKQLRKEYSNVKQQIAENVKAMNDLGNATKSSTNLISGMITKLGGFVSVIAIVKGLVNTFNEFQQTQKELVVSTGATGEALHRLSNSVLEVQGSVVQSQNEIAQAIGEVNTRLGIEGNQLEETTTQYLKFANATGQNGKQAIADNIKMFNSWGVSIQEQSKYLDQLAYAGQRTGADVSQLTTNLQQNSAVLQQMGFSLTDSISLLSQFEEMGVEANSTLQAMKIGITNLVKDGIAPSEAWNTLITNIQNAKNDTEGLSLACEYFGNRGGVQMFKAIKSGTVDVKAFNSELENSIGTVDKTNEAMETFGEFLSRKWNGIMADFIQWNNEGFWSMKQLVGMISDELSPAVEKAEDEFGRRKRGIEYLIQGKAELGVVGNQVGIILNEEGIKAEESREKFLKLQEAQEQAKIVQEQYNQSAKLLNQALANFDALKIDDSATRSEFEASKNSALELAKSFQIALASKLSLAQSNYHEAIQSKDIKQIAGAYKDLNIAMQEQVALNSRIAEIQNAKWSGKTTGGGSGSGSSSKKNEEDTEFKKYQEALAKEMQAYQKAVKKYNQEKEKEEANSLKKGYDYAVKILGAQEKKVEELKKTYEKEFDEITKKIKESANEIDKLNKEIDKLNDSMTALGKEENKSVAGIVVDSQNSLKELEKEFEGITDIAKNTSWDELENALSGDFIGGYSVENLKKAKGYVDNLASAYDGLSDDEARALDEEIEYQKWYNSLNDVQKTREDYKIKRDEIQKELDAKIKALADEMIKYAELDSDRKKLEDEWLQKIADEESKYNEMYQNIKQYQTDYMKQLADDWITQQTMINDLEAGRKRVAEARRDAQSYSSEVEGRATGGSVSGGTPYLVGENGPELFVPSSNGTIVPNNEITNNNGITINLNGTVVRGDSDINAITDEIIRKIKLEKSFGIS